jgi:ribosome maturation factor RimP
LPEAFWASFSGVQVLADGGYQHERIHVGQGHPGTGEPGHGMATPVAAAPKQGWQNAISSTVTGLGYELVEVERAQRGLLRIYIDRIPGQVYTSRRDSLEVGVQPETPAVDTSEFVTVEDCEKVTRQLQYALEVEGLDYARLEVSSPGLDRPLKREADYRRFVGQAVQLTLKMPFQGRKAWQGVLTAQEAAGENAGKSAGWSLVFKEGKTEQVLNFTFAEVREARLLPVVDFKGRKSPALAAGGDSTGAAAAAPQATGG